MDGSMDVINNYYKTEYATLCQGSEKWKSLREDYATTGSRLAGVLGMCPYNSRYGMMQRLLGLKGKPEANDNMNFGIDHETFVAGLYLAEIKKARPNVQMHLHGFMQHPYLPYFGASIDRLIHDPDTDEIWGLEIKTQPKAEIRCEVPVYHRVQLLAIAECYQVDRVDYACWSPASEALFLSSFHHDGEFWDTCVVPALIEWNHMRQVGILPPKRMKSKEKQARIELFLQSSSCTPLTELDIEQHPPQPE